MPSEGQTLPYYTKGTSRTKIRPSHVKIMAFDLGCRSFILKKKKKKMARFGQFPYIPLAVVSSYFVSVFRETLQEHSQLPKKAGLGRLQAFRMYGGIGMSASSLHRESTDSLIVTRVYPTF